MIRSVLCLLASAALLQPLAAENWNQFRGPNLDGIVSAPIFR